MAGSTPLPEGGLADYLLRQQPLCWFRGCQKQRRQEEQESMEQPALVRAHSGRLSA